MKAILAVDKNWGIGKDGDMLFHLKKDLDHFKNTTTGHTLIMGRSTFESMGGALPNRENLVLTHNKDYKAEGAKVFNDPSDVLAYVEEIDPVFVIGGAQIIEIFLEQIDEAIITKIDASKDADTYLHNFDDDPNFEIVDESETITDDGISFNIVKYRRI